MIPRHVSQYGVVLVQGGHCYRWSDALAHLVCSACGGSLAKSWEWTERWAYDEVISCVRRSGRDIRLERGDRDD